MKKCNSNSSIISESNFKIKNVEKYISHSKYKEEMINKVEPYLKKKLENGYIIGEKDLKLYYEKFICENAKANIVICHGFGECTEKYYELIYYFMNEGYSVFIIEHRGNARSQRLGIDDYQISVDKFFYYIEDFKRFIDEVVIPNGNHKKLLLFAHSMGGAIGTMFLERYQEYFLGAVLSAPMHEINTGKVPKFVATAIARIMKLCGKRNQYLPGQEPYNGEKRFSARSTSCKERYEYQFNKVKNIKSYQTGGSSAQWYLEGTKATREMVKKKNASKVKIPVLLFQAEYDTHVIPRGHYKFAGYAKDCRVICIKGSKHEPYFEIDKIAFAFIERVLSFYAEIIN